MNTCVYYHGTHWSVPDDPEQIEESAFFDLDEGYSDLAVVYVTNLEDTAVYFSRWNKTAASDIQVILKGEIAAENILNRSAHELQRDAMIEIDGIEYAAHDREELFQAMRPKYDGFCISGNYDGKGDDIALFGGHLFNASSAKLLIDGAWTDWLDRDDALETYLKASGQKPEFPGY